MTPTRIEFQVVPAGDDWEIRQDGVVLLTVQTKQVAVDEAVVQAQLAGPSHVAVRDLDGEIEEEADFGVLPAAAATAPRRRGRPQPAAVTESGADASAAAQPEQAEAC